MKRKTRVGNEEEVNTQSKLKSAAWVSNPNGGSVVSNFEETIIEDGRWKLSVVKGKVIDNDGVCPKIKVESIIDEQTKTALSMIIAVKGAAFEIESFQNNGDRKLKMECVSPELKEISEIEDLVVRWYRQNEEKGVTSTFCPLIQKVKVKKVTKDGEFFFEKASISLKFTDKMKFYIGNYQTEVPEKNALEFLKKVITPIEIMLFIYPTETYTWNKKGDQSFKLGFVAKSLLLVV